MKRSDNLFGVVAVFNTPDEIISAAKKTADSKFKKFDVHTPYPVHGMDAAMKMKPSKLGMVTLFFGLSGTVLALLLTYWTMSIDYPMIIGGKPFFAFPAFIPVAFEVTVLFATLATIIGMLTFFFYYPDNSYPLHDTFYSSAVSDGKFGVCIEADSDDFNADEATEFLISIHGNSVASIYYPVKESHKVFEPRFLMFLGAVAILVAGGTYFTLNKLLYMDPLNWMMEQNKITAQKPSSFFTDYSGLRMPVNGTVARNYITYEYKGLPEPTTPLTNPLPVTKESLALGKKKFDIFCSPCHGYYGEGDGRLRGQFPQPPSLLSTKVRDWKDGNIYHVITNGQNVMASYATQLNENERWAIVNYIRAIQLAKGASSELVNQVKQGGVK